MVSSVCGLLELVRRDVWEVWRVVVTQAIAIAVVLRVVHDRQGLWMVWMMWMRAETFDYILLQQRALKCALTTSQNDILETTKLTSRRERDNLVLN